MGAAHRLPGGDHDVEKIMLKLNKESRSFVLIHGKDVHGKHTGYENGARSYR